VTSAVLFTRHTSSDRMYHGNQPVSESVGRYVKRATGTTIRPAQFRVTKVSLVDLNPAVAECVDVPVTVSAVENEDMSAAQKAQVKPFLAGAGAMAAGFVLVMAGSSLAIDLVTNIGGLLSIAGGLVAAGASERFHRGG
jgi:hypothetical protein